MGNVDSTYSGYTLIIKVYLEKKLTRRVGHQLGPDRALVHVGSLLLHALDGQLAGYHERDQCGLARRSLGLMKFHKPL